ncbi:hypothetical protein KXV97_006805 [Aspergillus fumigatus]|nr:hypothetical protein KXV97_006805 [Aspergillus fumigatus]
MGDTADSVDEDAQAELIQIYAEACLRQMLGQALSWMGVQALDDLGLPYALALAEKTGIYKSAEYVISDLEVGSGIDDEEGSGSNPGPSGRGYGSGAQDDDSDGNDGYGLDDHGNSGRRHGPGSRGRRPGTDDSYSNRRDDDNNNNDDNDDNDNNDDHGNSGCEPRDSNRDNPACHDNDDNDDGCDPGHRVALTLEESEAARARLLEVYRNA